MNIRRFRVLHDVGASYAEIAAECGCDWRTVKKYLSGDAPAGPAPLRRLFDLLAGPLGRARTPGVMFGRYRTVAFDGCRSIKVPDSERNRAWLGKLNASAGVTGYPVIQLMSLVESGTRALLGAVFGTPAEGEIAWARRLLDLLDEHMLVLADRGFDAAGFLTDLAATNAQFLVRIKGGRRMPTLGRLPDGSMLSLIGQVQVRIITAHVTVTCHDGTRYAGGYRLATTLLDHHAYPATALIGLYHERWEHEITYLALRHTPLTGRVLRSHDPSGLQQEMWALLTLYQALRAAIIDAVHTAGGIGRAALAKLNPPRRPRISPRRVKSPLSRWNKHPEGKPRSNLRITKITATGHDPAHWPPTRHHRGPLTATAGP